LPIATSVARKAGIEGVRRTGKSSANGDGETTGNVNELAANLTTVRAIAAIAKSRAISPVQSQLSLRRGRNPQRQDNQMIANLRETNLKTLEQDWLKPTWRSLPECCRDSET